MVLTLGLPAHTRSGVAEAAIPAAPSPQAPPGGLPPLLPAVLPGSQPSLPPPLPDLLPQPVKDALAQLMPPNAVPEKEGLKPAASEPAPYWGLGSWVDLYDYGHPGNSSPEAIVDEMASRGVRTVYVQTARWNSTQDIEDPGAVGGFLHRAHDKGMKVVGWYIPGFADLDLDIRRTMAILQYSSVRGDHFDGLAPDIEDRAAVGGSRDAFNAGIVAYSERLRAAVPQGTVLAAIVPDAKNNERAPSRWAGFPWPDIARLYDVVMPMDYWTVAKPLRNCTAIQMDAGAYTREVMDKTVRLMGTSKPIHVIGGIADCTTPQEVQGYADAVRSTGAIGGGLYDWVTNTQNAARETLWAAQAPLH
jgi:hypothetical protein